MIIKFIRGFDITLRLYLSIIIKMIFKDDEDYCYTKKMYILIRIT